MITQRLLVRISLPLLLLLMTHTVLAQKVISGRVTDSKDGSPIVGATVQPRGGTGGTSTGNDGSFRITVGNDVTTLVVSYIGFGSMDIDISGKTSVDVSLTSSANNNLNEVVVVGYGTARKKDLTGSVTSIKAKDFNRGIVTAPDQLIQGKVSGVQIVNNSGAPGGGTTIRIRGNSSIRSGNSPLFVIDGVPLDGRSPRPGFGGSFGNTPSANPLNFINPNDIASIDVLKDASATAIYGSRGANGVVIITTKRGVTGQPKIEFNTSAGVSSILKKYDVLTGEEYRAALKSYGITSGDFGTSVDAMDAILRTGFTQNYNVSMSGGTEGGRYRMSIGAVNQQGIVKRTDFKKYVANISGQFRFLESKRLGLDFNIIASQNAEQIAPISTDAGFEGSLIGQALQWNPTHALTNPDGTIVIKDPALGNTTINPLAILNAYDDRSKITEVLASVIPSFKITNDLEYKFLFSVNYGIGNRRASILSWLNLTGIEGRGAAFVGNQERTTQQYTHTLNYTKQINPSLNINALAGYEYQKFNYRGYGMNAQDFQTQDLDYTYIFQNTSQESRGLFSFIDPTSELQSYFGRIGLNFKDKFLMTATMRADGSSKFGDNNKYGYFPSFAVAWNVTNEEFMKSSSFVNNLKVRVGWGRTGNQEFPAGSAQERYALGISGPATLGQTNVANPDLKWETSTTINAGIDFSLIGDRLFGTIDYFNKSTTDLLFNFDAIQPAPAAKYWINLNGEVINKGLEVALTGVIVRRSNFDWTLGVNAAFLQNTIKGYSGPTVLTGALHGQGSTGAAVQRLANDHPLNAFYVREYLGIDKTTGLSTYTDNGNSMYYIGDPNPNALLGLNTELRFKKLLVTLNMHGAFGHEIYNNTLMSVIPINNLGNRNIASSLIGGVKEDKSNAITSSSRYLEKGDFLKLSNATLSYTIGNVGRAVKGLTVFVTGQNLFVITDYSGFDPEVNT
ncbi:MAG: SusC/RagA family TonB-linked outer membrane protein, partial [Chitinophagaceae bacterium]